MLRRISIHLSFCFTFFAFFFDVLLIIKNYSDKHSFNLSYESLRDFYFDIIKNQSISLVGDIKSEVRIMGLVESRGIDFDNVIFCSANEGLLNFMT